MIDLFLAIFGMPYLAIKFAIESGKNKAADDIIDSYRENTILSMSEWESKVVDVSLQRIINNDLREHNLDKYEDEILTASKELSLSGVSNMLEMIRLGITNQNCAECLERILMANRGKLTRLDASYGIDVEHCKTYNEQLFEIEQKRELALWIDNKLKEHGVIEDLYLDLSHKLISAELADNYMYMAGSYKWRPMINASRLLTLDADLRENVQRPHGFYHGANTKSQSN